MVEEVLSDGTPNLLTPEEFLETIKNKYTENMFKVYSSWIISRSPMWVTIEKWEELLEEFKKSIEVKEEQEPLRNRKLPSRRD